jgi:hypothetical protein
MRAHDSHERRRRRRFEIQMDLRCKLPDTGKILKGTTYDISNLGVRFRAHHSLPVGQSVELSLTWPVRLDERCPLQLVVHGCVIRDDGRGIAIVANSHEFRLLQRP